MSLSGPPLERPIQLARALQRGLESKPADIALMSSRRRWSWRDVDALSDRVAANWRARGLRPGDRVASLMPNRAALVVHYLACLKAGLVTVPLNYRFMPPEIDHALEVAGASVLLAHAERDADVSESRSAARLPLGVVRYEGADGGCAVFEDRGVPAPPPTDPDPSAPAAIFFTSGSTGPAKGVTHTHATFGWALASVIEGLGFGASDVILPGSSFAHVGGFGISMAALAAGARVVIPRVLDSAELLPLLRESRPTVLSMLPSSLFRLVRDHGATREDFASLRLCRGGGDAIPIELENEFTALTGLEIEEGYGMTEAGLISTNRPGGPSRIGSLGAIDPGVEVSIRNDRGEEVPAGEDGTLWVRAPSVMVGYWNSPEATAAAFRDGWFDSGDVISADVDGYLWFRGRKKQIIVHDGSNICPQEVEGALLEHPAVESAGVVGVHDLIHGENVQAYVVLKETASPPSVEELIRFARARVGYKAPEEIRFLEAMPLTASGKTDRTALKRFAEASPRPDGILKTVEPPGQKTER